MKQSSDLWRVLWAKTDPSGRWHALPYHLLDVGSAANALWDRLPEAARAWNGNSTSVDRRTAVFLAAAHDIGKANRFFQSKASGQRERLRRAGFQLPSKDVLEPERHGQATGAFLKQWLMDRWTWNHSAASTTALAVGGHHGRFFRNCNLTCLEVDQDPWTSMGADLLDELARVIGVWDAKPPACLNPFLGWLAGFVSVADWLGSHESMTVWETGNRDLGEYFAEAQDRANVLLEKLNWCAPTGTDALPLHRLVPDGRLPNSLQLAASSIATDFSLAIVEAPTGEGKTESAFALAEPSRSCGSGIYFALPTMATANGLHKRVQNYLQFGAGGENVEARLLHSQAWLFRETASTISNPGQEGDEQEAQAQDWFAGSKRGLLAPYGVGTIDQALIAALRAKHGFVRLFALAGKTVVIDEVHAYDVYMGDLLDVLLGWLRALNSKVVMLSATLPSARREQLLRAWGCQGELPQSIYPCITYVDGSQFARSSRFEVQHRKPLIITLLARQALRSWEQGASRILERVRDGGGSGALVMNTVRDAQLAYEWLCEQDLGVIEVDLFHARFTAHDRNAIEKRVEASFGKNSVRNKPRILVATQVVEQSLDLDFDHMVTALAPVDLLIQRAGRVHRHKRLADGTVRTDDGEDERPDPVLEVLAPSEDESGVPDIKDPVYARDILLRSLAHATSSLRITSPSDVSAAVDAVYSASGRAAVVEAWEAKLLELERKTVLHAQSQGEQAERASIGRVDDPDNLIVEALLDMDENDERQGSQLAARTRLEDRPSITLVLMRDGATTIHGDNATDPRGATFASVRCSPPYPLWKALLEQEPLLAWRRKGALSQARPLVLPEGSASIGSFAVFYDASKGLDWRQTNANFQA